MNRILNIDNVQNKINKNMIIIHVSIIKNKIKLKSIY